MIPDTMWLFYAALGMYLPILILCAIAKARSPRR